ncbi:Phosphatidylinositol 4-phosphate 5-kinase 1 [Melia azedarach]|uniref:Phosphatidylinositol 4-phosphate 5-kinase 1 n=1 Tax=Melia azedarach TaxID=155640 RepID=A0ACC1XMR3_MELAZ|nr:Phosphatidylinositol 4-phosphate 5-kinase 1 [Melia azedarach]
MNQKKFEQQQQQKIGEKSSDICISFDLSTPQSTCQNKTHLHIQIPQPRSEFNHETLLSTPHKRPIMAQTEISHSPTFSSLNNPPHKKSFNRESTWHSSLCSSLGAKSFARKLAQNVYRICLLRFHLRFLILFSFPSLYFFFTYPRRFLVLNFIFLLAFFVTILLISLNVALPRFPSLRSFLSRTLPIKFVLPTSSVKEPLKPVVWSIGSKPKPVKHLNSGSRVYVCRNGDVFEGEFHKGKCSGSGVYYYFNKGRYEGDWIDGKYDGYGVETWTRGSRYRGQFRQGLRHGIGLYRSYTGDVYAGEWSNGQCHGCGVQTCEDGSRYVGEFKRGVKHGLGYYHYRNGDTYSGEYFADMMHGFGVYQFANGHRYEGSWHEGTRQGLGMYTFRNGETQSGHWQNGVLDVPHAENPNPASPYCVSHSKVLNAVQEAQRASAKAYEVAMVEERVNKAVAAANKAANAARVAAVKAVQNQMHHNNGDDVRTPVV